MGSFWEASGVLLVTFGLLRSVLVCLWVVSESFVRLLGHAEQRKQKINALFEVIWKVFSQRSKISKVKNALPVPLLRQVFPEALKAWQALCFRDISG